MDVEYVIPLLRWLETAPITQLRRAAQACAQHQTTQLLTQAIAQSVTLALPTVAAVTEEGDSDSAAAAPAESSNSALPLADAVLGLPAAVQPHVRQFVQDTVESLTQLTTFLLAEQLSESIDSASVLRSHVSGLIHSGNRAFLLLLHSQFCGKATKPSALLASAQAVSASSLPQSPVAPLDHVVAPAITFPSAAFSSSSSATSIAASSPAESSSSCAAPATSSSLTASSSASSSSSPSTIVVASSFLQSSGDHTDLLCLMLSYVGVWELLGSASHVCMRWLRASLDPRCFRQITHLEVTQFMDPPPLAPAAPVNEWAWTPAPPPVPTFLPPTEAAYAAFTNALAKLGNLQRLDFGPKTTDRALVALGRGAFLERPISSSSSAFLNQLRILSLRNCETITDEGLKALVGPCTHTTVPGGSAPVSPAAISPSSSSSSSSIQCVLHGLVILDLSGCRHISDRGLSVLLPHLPALRHADLSHCAGVGLVGLTALARHCRKLTRLNLAGARKVDDDCLRALAGGGVGATGTAGLSHLRTLSIEDCWNVTPTGLLHLSNGCRSLRELNCSGTYNAVGESAFLPLVTRCAGTLTTLDFTGCPLTDASVRVLVHGTADETEASLGGGHGGLQQLVTLRMSMLGRMGPSTGELTDLGVAAIASSRAKDSIRVLDLTGCTMLTDQAVHLLAERCTQLQTLVISRCSALTDASMVSLSLGSISRTLLSLDVSHVYQLTDGCLPAVTKLRALRELNVKKCLRLTDASWSVLHPRKQDSVEALATLPLQALDLSGCKISDHGIRQLHQAWRRAAHRTTSSKEDEPAITMPSAMPPAVPLCLSSLWLLRDLLSIALNECHAVGDEGLALLLPLCPQLTTISLVGCHRVTDQSLRTMANCNVALRTVLLHQCIDVTNEGVEYLSVAAVAECSRLPGLYELGLDELSALSNAALLSISSHCAHLRRLSVARAAHITYHAIHTVLTRCRDLRHLNCALSAQLTAVATTHPDPMWQAVLQMVARRGVHFLR